MYHFPPATDPALLPWDVANVTGGRRLALSEGEGNKSALCPGLPPGSSRSALDSEASSPLPGWLTLFTCHFSMPQLPHLLVKIVTGPTSYG
jgi:hypothetical protein